MCVAWCLAFVDRCVLLVEVIRCVVCCLVFAVRYCCCVVRCSLFVVRCRLVVACCVVLVVGDNMMFVVV